MPGKSDYLEKRVLDLYGGAAITPPATFYIALFTADPTDAASGAEATGAGYARLAVTNNTTNFPAATGTTPAVKTNGAAFTFAAATGNWSSGANLTHWALFDASSAGNMWHFGALDTPKPVLSGDQPVIPASSMTISED